MQIFLAGGCFWGVENFLRQVPGVRSTEVGYTNGPDPETNYDAVCDGAGHAECVKVDFDEEILPLEKLLNFFYQIIDPTSVNRQGNDRGVQYRTGIYYADPKLAPEVEKSLQNLAQNFQNPIVVEHAMVENYVRAEEYHQKYLIKNPNGYCHISKSHIKKILGIN